MMILKKSKWNLQLQPSSSSPNPKRSLLIYQNSAPNCGKVKINTHFISHVLSIMDLFCK